MQLARLAAAGLMTLGALQAEEPLRIAIAGLVHGHVDGFLRAAQNRKDVRIVGLCDADRGLHRKYAAKYGLPPEIFYSSVTEMLDASRPEAMAAFSSTFDHPPIVEAAASRKLPVMMEKPLAVSVAHARRIQSAAARSGIPVIVNYETTWYRSHGAIWKLAKEQKALGEIRKVAAMDGHPGPREIGVGPEFLGWLTDPVQNGAGALFDFGCYGANLMTWLMDNARPIAVTATTQRMKPDIYPQVDDEATIVIEYPRAQAIVQASWNWPFSRKDLEVYGQKGQAIATGGGVLRVRMVGEKADQTMPLDELPELERDSLTYLTAVARGKVKPSGLSSLENNLVVTEVLEAARESARRGKRVVLQ
jgi:predicted dehydrogenase